MRHLLRVYKLKDSIWRMRNDTINYYLNCDNFFFLRLIKRYFLITFLTFIFLFFIFEHDVRGS